MDKPVLIPEEKIDHAILMIRGHKVMLDTDLADIYGIESICQIERIDAARTRKTDKASNRVKNKQKGRIRTVGNISLKHPGPIQENSIGIG